MSIVNLVVKLISSVIGLLYRLSVKTLHHQFVGFCEGSLCFTSLRANVFRNGRTKNALKVLRNDEWLLTNNF